MKAGTTTLYHDLAYLEGVTRGPKESALFTRGAGHLEPDDSTVTVDVCAEYSMTHMYPDVPDRVVADLGTDIPLLYILRDPLERVESHLRHLSSLGQHVMPSQLDEDHHVVLTSRYGYQVDRWLRAGHTRLHLLDFHEYSAARSAGIKSLGDLLGVRVGDGFEGQDLSIANSSRDLRSARLGIRAVVRSSAYAKVKPLIPEGARRRLKNSRLTEKADADIVLPPAVRDRLTDVFRRDLERVVSHLDVVPEWARDYRGLDS